MSEDVEGGVGGWAALAVVAYLALLALLVLLAWWDGFFPHWPGEGEREGPG